MKRDVARLLLSLLDRLLAVYFLSGRGIHKIYIKLWGRLDIRWFDHHYEYVGAVAHWAWLERGLNSSEVIRPGWRVLDLCCGDGFYTRNFISAKASHVDALDFDSSVIAHANKRNSAPNIRYICTDAINECFPAEEYDAIVMNVALEYFSPAEQTALLGKIRKALPRGHGVFAGCTPIWNKLPATDAYGQKSHMTSKEMLRVRLKENFSTVLLWESCVPGSNMLLFRCQEPVNY